MVKMIVEDRNRYKEELKKRDQQFCELQQSITDT